MKKKNKIVFATLGFALAFGGGLATSDLFTKAETLPDNVLESLVIEPGMSIRTDLPDGLRFTATIGMSDEEYAQSGITEIGTVLMPTANVDGELTVDEKDGSVEALLIKTEKWITENDENSKSYYSTLVATDKTSAFPEAFYNTPISARAYVKYEDGTVKYSANTATRSISYVARFAMLDDEQENKGAIEKFANGATQSVTINEGEVLSTDNTEGYQASLIVGGVTTVSTDKITVVWSVKETDPAISVDQNGMVVPVKAGTATLVAEAYVGENCLREEVSVSVKASIQTRTEEVALFAIKETNDDGEIIVNDYQYSGLNGSTVNAITIQDEEVSAEAYSLEDGVLTVRGSAFANYSGLEKTLSVKTDADDLTVSFDKVATFKVTKASDMDTDDTTYKTVSPMVRATLISEASGDNGISWGGYIVLGNDIDFGMSIIENTLQVLGTQYDGMDFGFKGTFDGQGYALNNFDLWGNAGYPGSLMGRIAFHSTITNVSFLNFRIRGSYSLGLFDDCWGTLSDVIVDGTIETNMNDSALLGKFHKNDELSGAVLKDSTIIARVGSSAHAYTSTETDSKIFASGSTFRAVENTTIQTAFRVADEFTVKGGTVETLAPSDYYAVKVNGDTENTVKANDFIGAIQGKTVQSAILYGRNGDAQSISNATISDGNVIIPSSSLASYVGRGQTLKVVTDEEVKYFYQDIVTYAIEDAGDLCAVDAGSSAIYECAEFIQACGVTSGTACNTNWGSGCLIILANDVDGSNFVAPALSVTGRIRTGAPLADNGSNSNFVGIFDGCGYTVSNIELYARGNTHHDSFFGSLGVDGMVKNVSFVSVRICDGGLSQGFFGKTSMGKIDNVYIDVTPNNIASRYAIGRFNDSVRVSNCTFIVRTSSSCATGESGDLWKIIDYATADPCKGTHWTNTVIYSDYRVRSSDCNLNSIIKPLSEWTNA